MSQPLYQQPVAHLPVQTGPARQRKWPWIAGIVVALAAGVAIGAAGARPQTQTGNSPASTSQAKPAVNNPAPAAPAVSTPAVLPKPADFTIGVKVLAKECFGSAGCNITYQIDPKYTGAASLPSDREITVVYEITGGEDPQVNRFTINGGTASYPKEELIQTPSSGTKLTAKATDVF